MAVIAGSTTLTEMPKLLERAKLSFVLALRQAFACSLTDPSLRYDPNPDLTKMRIYTAHPLTIEFFPSLVVSTAGGDASIRYLQDDFVDEDVPNSLVHYAGRVEFTISITILSSSTLERERILDHLIVFVRHLFRDVLHGYGIEYFRDMRVGSENIVEVENRPVYEQTMDIPIYMEYKATIDQSTLDTIKRIDASDIAAVVINNA